MCSYVCQPCLCNLPALVVSPDEMDSVWISDLPPDKDMCSLPHAAVQYLQGKQQKKGLDRVKATIHKVAKKDVGPRWHIASKLIGSR